MSVYDLKESTEAILKGLMPNQSDRLKIIQAAVIDLLDKEMGNIQIDYYEPAGIPQHAPAILHSLNDSNIQPQIFIEDQSQGLTPSNGA